MRPIRPVRPVRPVRPTKPIEKEIVQTFLPFAPEKIILFGSWAVGQADEYSDIDVIIVYRTDKRFLDRLRELYLAWDYPKAVDILSYTPEEFFMMMEESPFLQDAVAGGKILYDGSH
ncbi:MAG: nucleotidyltransferase domain-containing protein [Thermodesulfobacteriota bacterium]